MTRRSWRRARVAHAGDRLQQRRDRLQARIPRIPQRESDIVPAGYTLFLTAWQSIVPDRTGACGGPTPVHGRDAVRPPAHGARDHVSGSGKPRVSGCRQRRADSVSAADILSENLALYGMAGALWLASQLTPRGAVWRDLGAGMLVSIATLTRVIPFVAIAIPLVLVYAAEHGFVRLLFARTARVLLVAAGLSILVAARHWQHSGGFVPASSTGFHFYNRIVTEQVLLDRQGAATRRFLGVVGERPLLGVPHWEIRQELQKNGFTYVQEEQLLRAVALEGLRMSPWAFALHSIVMTGDEYASDRMGHPLGRRRHTAHSDLR